MTIASAATAPDVAASGPQPPNKKRMTGKKRDGLPTRGGPAPFKFDRDSYYTPAQLAEMSGYTVKTLATLRSQRKMFPFVKLGGTIYYKGSALIDVLERHVVEVGPEKT